MTRSTSARIPAAIRPLDGMTSKTDEIAFLEAVAALCGEGSYLSSLYTPAFLATVRGDIRNDLAPDVYGQLAACGEELNQEQQTVRELRRQLENSRSGLDAERARRQALQDDLDALRAEQREIVRQRNEAESLSYRQAEELIRLKARLYDLEHGA